MNAAGGRKQSARRRGAGAQPLPRRLSEAKTWLAPNQLNHRCDLHHTPVDAGGKTAGTGSTASASRSAWPDTTGARRLRCGFEWPALRSALPTAAKAFQVKAASLSVIAAPVALMDCASSCKVRTALLTRYWFRRSAFTDCLASNHAISSCRSASVRSANPSDGNLSAHRSNVATTF